MYTYGWVCGAPRHGSVDSRARRDAAATARPAEADPTANRVTSGGNELDDVVTGLKKLQMYEDIPAPSPAPTPVAPLVLPAPRELHYQAQDETAMSAQFSSSCTVSAPRDRKHTPEPAGKEEQQAFGFWGAERNDYLLKLVRDIQPENTIIGWNTVASLFREKFKEGPVRNTSGVYSQHKFLLQKASKPAGQPPAAT